MRVRALQAQPDAVSPTVETSLLIAGDVALALTLAALTFLATASHYDEQNRPVGIALILRHRTEIAR
jgi:hypothetical protein